MSDDELLRRSDYVLKHAPRIMAGLLSRASDVSRDDAKGVSDKAIAMAEALYDRTIAKYNKMLEENRRR